jgi:hypothetical protein
MLMCHVHLLNDGRVLLFFAFNFLYHIPNLIHWCMAIQFRNKITPGSAPIFFQCPSSFRPEDAKIGCPMLDVFRTVVAKTFRRFRKVNGGFVNMA